MLVPVIRRKETDWSLFSKNNVPTRVVLVNYVTDASGNSDYQAVVSVPAGPDHVNVKYLRAPSVSEKLYVDRNQITESTSFHLN